MDFITTDADKLYNQIITSLENSVGESLYPGDERRLFAEGLVAVFVAMFNAMNDAAKQKMLRYARGEVLDALGERVGVERIPATKATTTIRFNVNSAFGSNIVIPQGTRVTGDSKRYFATVAAAILLAGETHVDVETESVGEGTEYNEISAGMINTMVDPIAYIDNVENITITAGGTDEESDDSLRTRILAAPSKLSTAGPIKSYRYWAMTADSTISDVVVTSEQQTLIRTLDVNGRKAYKGGSLLLLDTLVVYLSDGTTAAVKGSDYTVDYTDDLMTITLMAGGRLADATQIKVSVDTTNAGTVRIIPICEGGEIPDEEILQKVYDVCNADDIRPMTDTVKVEPPTVRKYDINLTYYTLAEDESACIETIESDGGAIAQYTKWQSGAIGRDINPDKLRALILKPDGENAVGAYRVAITSPTFAELDETTIAQFSGTMTVKHEVVKE